jgi:uncharacterized repeat protein (TIGR03803 family)
MTRTIDIVIFLALAIFAQMAEGATSEKVIHSFGRSVKDGIYPIAGLVFDGAGAAYGSATQGGTYGAGMIFKLTPSGTSWKETVLYDFHGGSDGSVPYSGVVLDSAGAVYGATVGGGTGTCFYQNVSGCGVVYKLTPPVKGTRWKQSVLYTFTGGVDGGTPLGVLLFDKLGSLYGTTLTGGTFNGGTVFSLSPSGQGWAETVLHSFGNATDGARPACGVVFDIDGNLWGTTTSGGQSIYWGTVFELSPSKTGWQESVIYSFSNGADGGLPAASLIFDGAKSVYGTTDSGGIPGNGTVFQITPPPKGGTTWTEAVIYNFHGGADGAGPQAPVISDSAGNLYGTATGSGESGAGVVFQLTPPTGGSGTWTEAVLYSFSNAKDGGLPYSNLVFGPDGNLYGTTYVGGKLYRGTVFRIVP